jgi:hypothetical protein
MISIGWCFPSLNRPKDSFSYQIEGQKPVSKSDFSRIMPYLVQ